MPLVQAFISTVASLFIAPVIFVLCGILFPFAVFTTYFAFIALAVRAALVQAQVIAALIRRQLGLEDDFTSPSSWAPRTKLEELEVYSRQRTALRRQSLADSTSPVAATNVAPAKSRQQSGDSSASSTRTITQAEVPIHGQTLSSDSVDNPPPTPRASRPVSAHSSLLNRDYEGIGGWRVFPAGSTPGPEPDAANFEWLVTNARLELPDADAASLTRPRTPEDRARSSSISGHSRRSFVNLNRRNHERSITAGSIELIRSDDSISLRSTSSRGSSLLERSRSGILSQSLGDGTENIVVGGRKIGEGKNKSMIFWGDKGSKLAFRLAGLKSLGMKKKNKGDPLSSPEESDVGTSKNLQVATGDDAQLHVGRNLQGTSSAGGSAAGSVEGIETGGLTMWMQP